MTAKTGFSTGALERGDYRKALSWIRKSRTQAVELSALRFSELEPLVNDLENLDLHEFAHVSFHAPSAFHREQEESVVELLMPVFERGFSIIVHPDVIYTPERWKAFGKQLLIENMDRRKPTGRTSGELDRWFKLLPEARLCLDVAHARELDATLTELNKIIARFQDRITEIHISELDSACQHRPMSSAAINAYQQSIQPLHRRNVVTIIESMLYRAPNAKRKQELESTQRVWNECLPPLNPV